MEKGFLLLFIFGLTLWAGCSRPGPEEGGEGVGPTVELELALSLDGPWEETRGPAAPTGRRFVVEIRRAGATVQRRTVVLPQAPADGAEVVLDETFALEATEYTLAVWSDPVEAAGDTTGGATGPYDTDDLAKIVAREGQAGSSGAMGALCAVGALDLREAAAGATVRVGAAMYRPLAGFRITTTDADAFREIAGREFPGQTAFGVRVVCQFYVPTAFDLWQQKPTASRADVVFEAETALPEAGADECELASGCVFATEEASRLPVTVEVYSLRDGKVIGRLAGLDIPYRRGAVTTLRGRFITALFGSGSATIDPGFAGGDIEIDLDERR